MRAPRTTCLALLAAVVFAAPGQALAEEIPVPTVNVKASAVPIPGFPGTGNFYGKGADVEAALEIHGSGYGATAQNPNGSPPPVSAVNVFLPRGVRLHPSGFATCAEATLKNIGARGCPKNSRASAIGSALGEVTFGSERVPEEASLQAFFAPGGVLLFSHQGPSAGCIETAPAG